MPQGTSETLIILSDAIKQWKSKCQWDFTVGTHLCQNTITLPGLPHSCPPQEGQLADGYFTHVKSLFKMYSLVYVGHRSFCRRSRSMSWPSAQWEVTSESRHHNVRQGNSGCLRTTQANDGDCQDQPGEIPASGTAAAELSGIDSHQQARTGTAQSPVQPRIPGDQGSSWIIYVVQHVIFGL